MVRHLPREPLGRQQRPYVISHVVLHSSFLERGYAAHRVITIPNKVKRTVMITVTKKDTIKELS